MFQNDIVALASIPEMYLLDDTGQHRIDSCMVALQVYAVMESRTSLYRVFAISESRIDFQEVERKADIHALANQTEKQGVSHIDKQWYVLLDRDFQAMTCLKGHIRLFCAYAVLLLLCNYLYSNLYLFANYLRTESIKLRCHLHADNHGGKNQ